MKPQRIQLKRVKGWRMPANTVKVDRSTNWGNPYRAGVETYNCKRGSVRPKDAAEACAMFIEDISDVDRMFIRANLRGLNLACWCAIGTPCHADRLLEIANEEEAP